MRPVSAFFTSMLLYALAPIAAQAAPPEDGPWSGEITCRYEVQGANYQDQQIHTWRLTANAPTNPGAGIRYYDATWSATGAGQRVIAATGTTETWRLEVPPQDGRLGIWQPPGSGRLRFASQHAGIVAPATLQVAGPQPMISAGSELSFQFVEGPASSSQINGSRERMYSGGSGWRQPPALPTRETCAWNFMRSGTAPPPATLPPTMMAGGPSAAPPSTPPAAPPTTPPATPPAASPSAPPSAPAAMPPGTPPAAPPSAPPATQPSAPAQTAPTTPLVTSGGSAIPPIPRERPSFTGEPTLPATTPSAPPAQGEPPPQPPSSPPVQAPPTRPTRPTIPVGSGGDVAAPTQVGSYLVSITQLVCGQPTQDDPMSFDGRGDEIMAGAQVWHFNRATGQLLGSSWRETLVYGDSNRSNRVQAGSISNEGGIGALDKIPGGSSVARVAAASEQVFPWRLWEGALATGQDALVIAPSLWEVDGNRQAVDYYRQRIRSAPPASIIAMPDVQSRIADTTLQVLEIGSTEAGGQLGAVGNAAFDTFTTVTLGSLGLPFLQQLVSHREDRPIGLRADRLPTTAVVVTREIAEAVLQTTTGFPQVLNTAKPGVIFIVPKPGILVIEFRDLATGAEAKARFYSGLLSNPLAKTAAQYFMVLQIERK